MSHLFDYRGHRFLIFLILPFFMFLASCKSEVKDKNVIKIDRRLKLVMGGGGNSGIFKGKNAIVVIDTKMPENAEKVYDLAMKEAHGKPIIVINTHYHMDHTGGNHLYNGSKIYMGSYSKEFLEKNLKPEDMPTDFVKDSLTIDPGGEKIILYNMGQAHTFDDVVVYLKNRQILFTGDLVFNRVNPVLKRESGADVDKWKNALKEIQNRWAVKMIVPGHGRTGGKEIAKRLYNYFSDMQKASADTSIALVLKIKYDDWLKMPSMASPQMTIDYIKDTLKAK